MGQPSQVGARRMTTAQDVLAKKQKLDVLRAKIRPGSLEGLDHSQRIDITYSSNAIEGNTLTAGETALVLEKGITIAGKPLKDHLEATDHAHALDWALDVASKGSAPVTETDIRTLHQLVVAKSKPEIAGRYADSARFVNTDTGVHQFPPPMDIPVLMADFCRVLAAAADTPQTAFDAHRMLVAIHPFNDGNGRTARLLMNLILLRAGYPAIAIRPEDRPAYIVALEIAQRDGDHAGFDALMFGRLDRTLNIYLAVAQQAQDFSAAARAETRNG